MARVSSKQTRQAILVTADTLEPYLIPERLALFDENGNPIKFLVVFEQLDEPDTNIIGAIWIKQEPAPPEVSP